MLMTGISPEQLLLDMQCRPTTYPALASPALPASASPQNERRNAIRDSKQALALSSFTLILPQCKILEQDFRPDLKRTFCANQVVIIGSVAVESEFFEPEDFTHDGSSQIPHHRGGPL